MCPILKELEGDFEKEELERELEREGLADELKKEETEMHVQF